MDYKFDNVRCFVLQETLDCGQAFRWRPSKDGRWKGVVYEREIELSIENGTLTLYNTTEEEFENIWKHYFDLDRDYTAIEDLMQSDETLKKMAELCSGVRVLNQEPWETLCSFIISQNNNIKRIKGIIERLCETFGKKVGDNYTFPSAEVIAELSLEDLAPLRSGFRAKYILDAAKRVASGEIDFSKIKEMDIDSARAELMKIYGVGEKVADCVLLFGLDFPEAFPKDVWIKRAMPILFPKGLPSGCTNFAGIIQQYIFSYSRKTKLDI